MITLKNLSLRRGVKPVLQGASATINPGERSAWWAATAPARAPSSRC